MLGWFWFIAGFMSCLAFSAIDVSFLVWRTPPASEQSNGGRSEAADDSPAATAPQIEAGFRATGTLFTRVLPTPVTNDGRAGADRDN